MAESSPTGRALLALELVQTHPGIGAGRLGSELGVSERAARRYIDILREAGIPIESVRGPYGGYHVTRGRRLPPLMFTSAEALGLVMAVLDGHHDAADVTAPAGSALAKILRSLPEPVASQAETLRRTAAPAPDRAAARPDPTTAATLVGACATHRRVRLDYRTEAGSQRLLELDPWAVIVRHGRWYLLGWSHAAGAQRAYRVDRVADVTLLDLAALPPADLDPVAALEDHLAVGWDYACELVVAAPLDTLSRRIPRSLGRLEPIGTTSTRLVGTTSNPSWYLEQLVTVAAPYRIVGCPELRQAARELGERLLAAAAPSV